jgi:hypothetical protein
MTRFLALLIGLSVTATAAPAIADSMPYPRVYCREAQMDDPNEIAKKISRERIVRGFEVIIDGVIESYQPEAQSGGKYLPGLVIMRVDKIWKGDVTPRVAYITGTRLFLIGSPATPIDCPNPMRTGVQVRIGTTISGKMSAWNSLFPEIDGNMDALDGDSYWSLRYLPPHDPALERLLTAYKTKTDTLRKVASTGDQQAMLAYATHLLDNNEQHRAHEVAAALHRAGVNLAPIGGALLLDPEQKNWSDLKRIRRGCYSDHGNFDDATFDRSDLAECAFRYSSFRNASFRGTDLSGSYFQNSDLTGAQYDCATKLPDDLDPKAARMINLDGSCPAP